MITSKDIQSFICKHWLKEHHCNYVCTNFSGAGFQEMDVIAVTQAGVVNEFEIKMSRSDFFADFKKYKHQHIKGNIQGNLAALAYKIPNKFYFAVPRGLVKPEEVPDYAGLLYFTKYQLQGDSNQYISFEYAKKAPYIHREKHGHELVISIAKLLSQRFILGCSLLTYNNREIREKNKKVLGL